MVTTKILPVPIKATTKTKKLPVPVKEPVKENIMQDLKTTYPKITLLIPCKNEEKNIPYVFSRIPSIIDEVLLVDAHSTDRTVELAKELRPDIRVIYQDGKGKGNAVIYGVEHATGDIVVMIDADVSMDPKEIPMFIEPLLNGYDFVKGSRFMPQGETVDMESYRKFGNQVFLFLVNSLFGGKYTDLCYGYNAFWRDAFMLMDITSDGFEIETEMNVKVLKAGLKVTEVPSYEKLRLNGESNLRSFQDGMRILKTIFKQRFKKTRKARDMLYERRCVY